MDADKITFACPACGVKLTVPVQMAGVSGPCPSCQHVIQAPHPAAPSPILSDVAPMPAAPIPVKPEPRHRPTRAENVETLNKPVAEVPPSSSTDSRIPPAAPMPRKSRRHYLRILVPLLFIAAAIAVMFGVMMFLKRPDEASNGPLKSSELPIKTILTDETDEVQEPTDEAPIAAPVPEIIQPDPTDPGIDTPEEIDQIPPGISSLKILESFLNASTLAERMPMIESRHSEEELASTVLAKPLSPVIDIATDVQESNALEKVTDVYFLVDFDAGNGEINPQTVLVRTRGKEAPKVVVDPFLDLYGGRLAEYAKAPVDKAGDFQILVSAVAFCYDEHVPSREKKLTLKLMSRDNTRQITNAYFGKQSKIGEMLKHDSSGLRYGQTKACTVLLHWNTEEDPQKPYLEALLIKALDWNP